jgi:two-component system, chemotaxis family, protein-glutamate methylesterase/glutaminase
MAYELVVIGVSAGGLHALCTIVRDLPEDFEAALVIVQHRSRDSDALCEILQECTSLSLREVVDKAPIQRGEVYLAPPDYHVLLEDGFFSLTVDEPVRYSRPSIDVTFDSAADAYGPGVIGVVLTGANRDGASGLRRIVDEGGAAVIQDPDTAEVSVMPRFAMAEVPEAHVVPLEQIAQLLVEMVRVAPARRPSR